MPITYYMVQLNPVLLFLLMICFGGIFIGLITFIFRKFINVKILRAHNEVTGFFFMAIASFYALLLGFVVFSVWEQLNEIESNVSKEGSSALALYRDIKYYPDSLESKELLILYMDFVYNVINEEIPNMARLEPSQKTGESFNKVFYKMEHLKPKSPYEIQLIAVMFAHLNDLASFRGLRTSSLESEIPLPMWLPIVFGAIITIICALLVDIEDTSMHVGLNALMGAFIAMLFFIIVLFAHPFSGSLAIQPKSYYNIFTVEQWSQEPPSKNK